MGQGWAQDPRPPPESASAALRAMLCGYLCVCVCWMHLGEGRSTVGSFQLGGGGFHSGEHCTHSPLQPNGAASCFIKCATNMKLVLFIVPSELRNITHRLAYTRANIFIPSKQICSTISIFFLPQEHHRAKDWPTNCGHVSQNAGGKKSQNAFPCRTTFPMQKTKRSKFWQTDRS